LARRAWTSLVLEIPPTDADALLAAWTANAAIMKRQPGFVSAPRHRGIAGRGVFLDDAVRDSVAAFRTAFTDPEFRARLADDPATATASPQLFHTVAVPGLCAA
jgi:hypothetical protein